LYDNLESNRTIYGGLYTYDQVMSAGFCPAGWHVATVDDWDALIAEAGGLAVAGGKLKEAGTLHWLPPNTDATNDYAFTALGGGAWMYFYGLGFNFYNKQNLGYFWAASPAGYNYVYVLRYDTGAIFSLPFTPVSDPAYKSYFSVRFVKDNLAAPVDVAGVVTIDVASVYFKALPQTPSIHGLIQYAGYLYAAALDVNPASGLLNLPKISINNYNSVQLLPIRYTSESDTAAILTSGQITRAGNYIYMFGTVFAGGANPLLIQYKISSGTYQTFKLNKNYGSVWGYPHASDDTHIFTAIGYTDPDTYAFTMRLGKYVLAELQAPSWVKFNTSYGDTGAPLTATVIDMPAVSYSYVHAIITDDTYVYVSMRMSGTPVGGAGKLIKIDKATMTVIASADIPNCTDDIAQTDDYVFLGVEVNGEPYTYLKTLTTVAVRKADMAVTGFLKHSTEAADIDSYGVFICAVGGVDYLLNLRTNKTIYVVDLTDPDSWTGAGDAFIAKILSFTYTDALAHLVLNELAVDGAGDIHATGWSTVPEIIKFRIAALP
jgi:uncharacterized protein (TIGR02145 family)